MKTAGRGIALCCVATLAFLTPSPCRAADPPAAAGANTGAGAWVNISDPVVQKVTDEVKKIAWPGQTAGVTVDPATGDVYMIVTGNGVWKSADRGKTFARCDGGAIGGRCETGSALNFDPNPSPNGGPNGGRLACFMLDGHGGMTLDSGKTWQPFTDVGRNWDYAAVDWSAQTPKDIFAARHESKGEMFLSNDAGKTWKKIAALGAVDDKFAALGIFDGKTLVFTKGDGLLRSADAGQTWEKVSDLTPVGRVMRVYKGVAYWVAKEGLIVSKDRGATWAKQGNAFGADASAGPWFKDETHLMVAGKKGFLETADGGQTWTPAAGFPPGVDLSRPGWFANLAWDPVGDVLYASRMGQPTYKLER